MYYTYILFSEKINRFYIGYSSNPQKRINEKHNLGYVKATAAGRPYKLVAIKEFQTEAEARAEELRLKKKKSRKYIEWIIQGNW